MSLLVSMLSWTVTSYSSSHTTAEAPPKVIKPQEMQPQMLTLCFAAPHYPSVTIAGQIFNCIGTHGTKIFVIADSDKLGGIIGAAGCHKKYFAVALGRTNHKGDPYGIRGNCEDSLVDLLNSADCDELDEKNTLC